VRIDFLEGFEKLPCLSELYNNHCKRYLLKTISNEGLREVIEQPARLANLDGAEVTTAILQDAQNEVGALPLVENALHVLWEQRLGNSLSSQLYMQKGGIAGLLEEQADALLTRLESTRTGGRADALELLLALTRINDEGRHTRRRLPLAEARLAAGGKKADSKRGQQVIDYLSGRVTNEGGNPSHSGSLRLITTVGDDTTEQSIDLIHETLIRARGKEKTTGKLVGYWKTLYDYIDKNRDRGFHRDQLTRQANDWQSSKGITRWFKQASWRDLKHYRALPLEKGSNDERFRRSSQRGFLYQTVLLTLLLVYAGQSYLWTLNNALPPSSMITLQQFRLMNLGLMDEHLPEMVLIKAPELPFKIGELDSEVGEEKTSWLKGIGALGQYNFGYPPVGAELVNDFKVGKYEVTYNQFDYYIWQQKTTGNELKYPAGAVRTQQRGQRPVTQVSWSDTNAYIQWLSDKTGQSYRLPTEVEWEYAARGGRNSAYFNGDEIGQNNANCDGCGSQWDNQTIAPVGSFIANGFDLHDTAGNVWEWTCSEWKTDFDGSESDCISPQEKDGRRVIRGGSWYDTAEWLRSSARFSTNTDYRNDNVGFRVYSLPRTN
jgi:formylglycine-generating enzyme required for sulfatase activity